MQCPCVDDHGLFEIDFAPSDSLLVLAGNIHFEAWTLSSSLVFVHVVNCLAV